MTRDCDNNLLKASRNVSMSMISFSITAMKPSTTDLPMLWIRNQFQATQQRYYHWTLATSHVIQERTMILALLLFALNRYPNLPSRVWIIQNKAVVVSTLGRVSPYRGCGIDASIQTPAIITKHHLTRRMVDVLAHSL